MASSPSALDVATIAREILHTSLQNIIHDILVQRHCEHKKMIMSLDATTKLPHCDKCNLPRLLDPPLARKVRGAGSDPPKDTAYCERKPWSRRLGHDIYDNPFPKLDVGGRPPTKKERGAEKNRKKDGDGTPASTEGGDVEGTAPPSPSADGEGGTGNGKEGKLEKGEKKASKIDEKLKKGEYVPWHTCPSCKRSLLITRFAKHLEQCMGLSGRAASRNAMAKINGSTPSVSRGGTPNPSQEGRDEDDDDERAKGSGGVRKKVLKKGFKDKMKKDKALQAGGSANGKATKTGNAKWTPQRASPAPSSVTADNGKRDRDELGLDDEGEDDDSAPVKKRQKLERVESTASVGSRQSSAPPPSAVDTERRESQDGSFMDDGSFVED